MFNAVRRRAAGMLFISEFSRCEMERLVGVIPAETRTKVTPLVADDTWRRARELAPQRPVADPYFIYVGNLKQHKNVPLLLRAFARAAKLIPHRLVIVGRRKGLRADPAIDAALRSHGNRVTYVGEIPIAALWGFVAHAEALVTASLYEGFGLPPLEAMAAGCPCIVSTSGALPEVCGDAALYSDPRDEEKLAEQMVTVATDPRVRGRLVEAGRRRAAEFSWDRCAAATIEVLESALARA
jgi:glycosyltransferase involved in cell wall biosynthesis